MAGKKEKKKKDVAKRGEDRATQLPEVGELRPLGLGFPSRLERWLHELEREGAWPSLREGWLPALDVNESDEEYAVTVELPGTSRDDVAVELTGNVLTVRGEKKSEREEQKEHRRVVERRYGSFRRSFSLPPDADVDRITARFENGVLTLTIPRTEQAKPRSVAIQ